MAFDVIWHQGQEEVRTVAAAEKKPAASLSPGSTAALLPGLFWGRLRSRDPREGAQMFEKGSEGFRLLSKLGSRGPSAAPGRPYQPQQGSSPKSSCLHKSDLAPNLLGSGGQGQRQRGRWKILPGRDHNLGGSLGTCCLGPLLNQDIRGI